MTEHQPDQYDGLDRESRRVSRDRGFRTRLWIAGILGCLLFLLVVADRFVTLVAPNLEKLHVTKARKSQADFQAAVIHVLDGYGIKPTWYQRKMIHGLTEKDIREEWRILVPRDIPLASMNAEIKQVSEEFSGRSFAVENAKTAEVSVHVRFGELIRHTFVFKPSRKVKRTAGEVVLMVDGLSLASKRAMEAFLALKEPIACIIVPTKQSVELYQLLRTSKKELVLHLHMHPSDDESDRYRLVENLSRSTLESRVTNILRSFRGAQYYYITSERASQETIDTLHSMLRSKGLLAIETIEMHYIDRKPEVGNLTSRMNDLADLATKYGSVYGVIELRDGAIDFLVSETMRLRKRGVDFSRLSTRFEQDKQ